MERTGGQDEDRVVPLCQLDQLPHTVVAGETNVDYQAGNVGDRVDGHILVLAVAQTSDVDFDVV